MAKRKFKGGRKRASGQRYLSGDLKQPIDHGTPYLALKREIAAGTRGIPEEGELTDALIDMMRNPPRIREGGIDPLGILVARHIIDTDQLEAAERWYLGYCAYIGRPAPRGAQFERSDRDHSETSDATLQRRAHFYWNAIAAMKHVNPMLYGMVREIVIDGQLGGLVGYVQQDDVVRMDGGLISRRMATLHPGLRIRIGMFCKALDIIAQTPTGDFSSDAERLREALRAREPLNVRNLCTVCASPLNRDASGNPQPCSQCFPRAVPIAGPQTLRI